MGPCLTVQAPVPDSKLSQKAHAVQDIKRMLFRVVVATPTRTRCENMSHVYSANTTAPSSFAYLPASVGAKLTLGIGTPIAYFSPTMATRLVSRGIWRLPILVLA